MKISDRLYLVGSEQFALSHPLDCNCYLIDGGTALALIDTGIGMGVDDILANIQHAGFQPERLTHIFITHSHLGHWGGAGELRKRTGARVYAPEGALKFMMEPMSDPATAMNFQFGRYPTTFQPRACQPDETFADGGEFSCGDLTLRTILTQGHTPDSTCFLVQIAGKRALFSGDVVFYSGKLGILNIDGCSLSDYRRDIRKLTALEIDQLFPGHGVFVLARGDRHIQRAARKLDDFVMPETFFETNEFVWDREYLSAMTK